MQWNRQHEKKKLNWSKIVTFIKHWQIQGGADPGFPEGAPTPKGEVQTYFLANCFPITAGK